MNRIFIEPGQRDGHLKIMIEEGGRVRHLNDAWSPEEARAKAERTAAKRGITCDIGNTNTKVDPGKGGSAPDSQPEITTTCPRPRGAPPIGSRIRETLYASDRTVEWTVTDYLAEQILGETDDGMTRIALVKSDCWEDITGR